MKKKKVTAQPRMDYFGKILRCMSKITILYYNIIFYILSNLLQWVFGRCWILLKLIRRRIVAQQCPCIEMSSNVWWFYVKKVKFVRNKTRIQLYLVYFLFTFVFCTFQLLNISSSIGERNSCTFNRISSKM